MYMYRYAKKDVDPQFVQRQQANTNIMYACTAFGFGFSKPLRLPCTAFTLALYMYVHVHVYADVGNSYVKGWGMGDRNTILM